jgi:acylphosphatase
MDASMIRRRVVVQGVVQGVGFRYSLRRVGESRGVAGWVRNHRDGTVEAVLEGAPDAVDAVVEWCRRGPRGAVIEEVVVQIEEPEGLAGFRIER